MDKNIILEKVQKIIHLWKQHLLGGDFMPEDANPNLEKESNENLLYFTLPMTLNYQRNSYKLWESSLKTFYDQETHFVFNPKMVTSSSFESVQRALVKYGVALQPNKQTEIWITLCKSICKLFDGNLVTLFESLNYDVFLLKEYITKSHKKEFPYLSGNKIFNYWLYVLSNYCNIPLKNKNLLNVAPDTHIIQASVKLGVISEAELSLSNVQLLVSSRWNDILQDTEFLPIDIHTPLWLWSRNGYKNFE